MFAVGGHVCSVRKDVQPVSIFQRGGVRRRAGVRKVVPLLLFPVLLFSEVAETKENQRVTTDQRIQALATETAANFKETDGKFREVAARFADLGQFINSLAHAAETQQHQTAAHDDQIGKLIEVAEKQHQEWEQLRREWQAYLTTIHPRQ